MKQSWLFCGWCALLLLWAQWISLPFAWLLLVLLLWQYRCHYRMHILCVIILLLFTCRMSLFKPKAPPAPNTLLQIREIKSGYALAHGDGQDVVVYHVDHVHFGDVIEVQGTYSEVSSLHNLHSFYFPDWLRKRGIHYQLQAKKVRIVQEGNGLRHDIFQRVSNMGNDTMRTWLVSMLYGIHEDDATYFLTSSGLHLSTLQHLIKKLALLILSPIHASLILLLLMGIVGHITVFSASLLRILLFQCIGLCCHRWNEQDRLGIAMVVTLLLFPYMAWELAFLLPVGFRMLSLFNVRQHSRRMLSLLLLIPMQYVFFQSCNPLQIVLFPLYRIVYALLYLFCILALFLPLDFLFSSLSIIAQRLQQMQAWGITLYYIPQLLWLIAWCYYAAHYMSHAQSKAIKHLALLFLYAPFASYVNPFGEVLMIDVGQGDATLITLPFHQGAILIDIMGSQYRNIPKEVVVPQLRARGYNTLDLLILTHDDADHSGGKQQLLEEIDVKQIIDNKQKTIIPEGFPLAFLLTDYVGSNDNDNSIITYMDIGTLQFLFMGDAGVAVEAQLLQQYDKLSVDVVKLGHHGSDTSSSLAFLHAVQPRLALISSGRNNRYRHPSPAVIERLQNQNIPTHVTARDGAVSIRFSKLFSYYVSAERTIGILDILGMYIR